MFFFEQRRLFKGLETVRNVILGGVALSAGTIGGALLAENTDLFEQKKEIPRVTPIGHDVPVTRTVQEIERSLARLFKDAPVSQAWVKAPVKPASTQLAKNEPNGSVKKTIPEKTEVAQVTTIPPVLEQVDPPKKPVKIRSADTKEEPPVLVAGSYQAPTHGFRGTAEQILALHEQSGKLPQGDNRLSVTPGGIEWNDNNVYAMTQFTSNGNGDFKSQNGKMALGATGEGFAFGSQLYWNRTETPGNMGTNSESFMFGFHGTQEITPNSGYALGFTGVTAQLDGKQSMPENDPSALAAFGQDHQRAYGGDIKSRVTGGKLALDTPFLNMNGGAYAVENQRFPGDKNQQANVYDFGFSKTNPWGNGGITGRYTFTPGGSSIADFTAGNASVQAGFGQKTFVTPNNGYTSVFAHAALGLTSDLQLGAEVDTRGAGVVSLNQNIPNPADIPLTASLDAFRDLGYGSEVPGLGDGAMFRLRLGGGDSNFRSGFTALAAPRLSLGENENARVFVAQRTEGPSKITEKGYPLWTTEEIAKDPETYFVTFNKQFEAKLLALPGYQTRMLTEEQVLSLQTKQQTTFDAAFLTKLKGERKGGRVLITREQLNELEAAHQKTGQEKASDGFYKTLKGMYLGPVWEAILASENRIINAKDKKAAIEADQAKRNQLIKLAESMKLPEKEKLVMDTRNGNQIIDVADLSQDFSGMMLPKIMWDSVQKKNVQKFDYKEPGFTKYVKEFDNVFSDPVALNEWIYILSGTKYKNSSVQDIDNALNALSISSVSLPSDLVLDPATTETLIRSLRIAIALAERPGVVQRLGASFAKNNPLLSADVIRKMQELEQWRGGNPQAHIRTIRQAFTQAWDTPEMRFWYNELPAKAYDGLQDKRRLPQQLKEFGHGAQEIPFNKEPAELYLAEHQPVMIAEENWCSKSAKNAATCASPLLAIPVAALAFSGGGGGNSSGGGGGTSGPSVTFNNCNVGQSVVGCSVSATAQNAGNSLTHSAWNNQAGNDPIDAPLNFSVAGNTGTYGDATGAPANDIPNQTAYTIITEQTNAIPAIETGRRIIRFTIVNAIITDKTIIQ